MVYDVEQAKVSKVCKFLRKYLNWVQNSVFEGEVSEGQLYKIQKGIEKIIDKERDSVLMFKAASPKWLEKSVIGIERNMTSNLI